MFPKSLTVVTLINPDVLEKLTEEKLAEYQFQPCGEYDALSMGFSKTYEDAYRFSHFNHSLLTFTVEKKPVPGSAIKRGIAAEAKRIEKETGFKPNKHQRKQIKEDVTDMLRARAIAVSKDYKVWLDIKAGRVMIEATTDAIVGAVLQRLYLATEANPVTTMWPSVETMTDWVNDNCPEELTLDDAVTMEFPGENGKQAKYTKANLDDADIVANIELGAQVLALSATWDSRVSFKLGKSQQLTGIKPTTFTKDSYRADEKADRFQNDFYLMTQTLSGLIHYLISRA